LQFDAETRPLDAHDAVRRASRNVRPRNRAPANAPPAARQHQTTTTLPLVDLLGRAPGLPVRPRYPVLHTEGRVVDGWVAAVFSVGLCYLMLIHESTVRADSVRLSICAMTRQHGLRLG
jgi:hypothetical protein